MKSYTVIVLSAIIKFIILSLLTISDVSAAEDSTKNIFSCVKQGSLSTDSGCLREVIDHDDANFFENLAEDFAENQFYNRGFATITLYPSNLEITVTALNSGEQTYQLASN